MSKNMKDMFIVYFIGFILGFSNFGTGILCGLVLMLLVWADGK